MALSGSNQIRMDSRNQVHSRVEWSATQNIANNTSTITVDVYTYFQYAIYANASADVVVDIGGQKSTVSRVIGSHPNGVNKRVARVTKTVKHNNDGTLRVRIKVTNPFRVTYAGQYLNNANHDFTITLNTIPRQSELVSVSNFTLPSSTGPTINIKSHVSSFRHNADLKVNGVFITNLRRVAAGTHTFNLTSAEQDKILNLMANTTSTKFEVVLGTYSGDTFIGKTQTKTATVSVSSSVVPIIDKVTHSEANGELSKYNIEGYVNKVSRVRFVTSARGARGAKIKQIRVKYKNDTFIGSNITTNVLSEPDDVNVVRFYVEVEDTRGRITKQTHAHPLVHYKKPTIDFGERGFYRVRETYDNGYLDYVIDEKNGNLLSSDVNVTVADIGDYNMPWSYKIEAVRSDKKEWETVYDSGDIDSAGEYRIGGGKGMYPHAPFTWDTFDPLYSYSIRVIVNDRINTNSYTFNVRSGFVLMDFHESGDGIAFGKSSEKRDTFEVALDAEFSGSVNTKDSITISTGTQNPTDNTLLRFRRKDGSLHSAFMYNDNTQDLRLHFYDKNGTWKTYFNFSENGTLSAGGRGVMRLHTATYTKTTDGGGSIELHELIENEIVSLQILNNGGSTRTRLVSHNIWYNSQGRRWVTFYNRETGDNLKNVSVTYKVVYAT